MKNQSNKILIIDDSEANLAFLKSLLEKDSYKVAAVNNGKSAITKTRSQKFDLILLDYEMPIMDGLTVCKRIKKNVHNEDTPIIFLTANRSEDVLIKAFNAGAVDYVKKPYSELELLARVKTHLNLVESKKELAIAKSYAETASNAKGEFLANMSHEVRTPMNGIVTVVEFLEETKLSNKQKEYIDIIKTSSENLLTIINDILDFSKIEAGQIELENINFNTKKELVSVLKPLVFKAKEKGLYLKLNFDKNSIPSILKGDALRVKQIIINLVNNAIKFTSKGGVTLNVKKITHPKIKNYLRFEIKDTGIGISKENISKLFKSFSQTDASSTRKYGGTGLGLAISKNLSEIMGGKIGVESNMNIGSTFWFEIPFDVASNESHLNIDSALIQSEIEFVKQNILIVDDNAINRKVAEMTIQKLGHRTEIAINGKDAYFKYLQSNYNLILMDVHMPELDGLETTALIREHEQEKKLNEIPIIAMTAAAMKGDRERFLSSGMNEYISKPFKVNDIKKVINRFCNT